MRHSLHSSWLHLTGSIRNNQQRAAFVGLVLFAFWLPRGLELDHFVTVDEPLRLMRSGNFYQALARSDFEKTFQRGLPGVSTTWAGLAGYLWRFPGYFKVGRGDATELIEFHQLLEDYQKDLLAILAAGRTFVVLAVVLASGLAFLYAAQLFIPFFALNALTFVAFDPFFIAHSRLLHLDGMLSAFLFLSLLAFLSYLTRFHSRFDLLISGLPAGLAFLTKSPALFLIPFFTLLCLLDTPFSQAALGQGRPWEPSMRGFARALSPLLGWLGLAATTLILLWPAMWAAPVESLERMTSQRIVYASGGHEYGYFFDGEIYGKKGLSWYIYLAVFAWRSTPTTMIGLVLAAIALIFRRRLGLPSMHTHLIGMLAFFVVLFTIFISAGAKKFDRYLLPVFPPIDLMAGFGWYSGVSVIRRLFSMRWSPAV